MECREYKLYVNGNWCDGKNGNDMIERHNPSSGKCVSKYVNGSPLDIDYASEIALRTLNSGSWSDLSRDKKSLLLMLLVSTVLFSNISLSQNEMYSKLYSSFGEIPRSMSSTELIEIGKHGIAKRMSNL